MNKALIDALEEECPYDMYPHEYSSFLRQVQNGERILKIVVSSRLKYGPDGGDITLLHGRVYYLEGKLFWQSLLI